MSNNIFGFAKGASVARITELEEQHKRQSRQSFSADKLHRDLLLASEQGSIYKPLFDNDDKKDPLVRVVGCQYFTYDHTRITKIISPPSWFRTRLQERMPDLKLDNTDDAFLGQLIMLAYRQVFGEENTINAWLLRTRQEAEADTRSYFALQLGEKHKFGSTLRKSLSGQLMPKRHCWEIVQRVCAEIAEIKKKGGLLNGAGARFEVAANVFARIKQWKSENEEAIRDPIDKLTRALASHRRDEAGDAAMRRDWRHTLEKTDDSSKLESLFASLCEREVVSVEIAAGMLQSAAFYFQVYGAEGFYTLKEDRREMSLSDGCPRAPYGLTVLTKTPLEEEEMKALRDYFQDISAKQDEFLRGNKKAKKAIFSNKNEGGGSSSGKDDEVMPESLFAERFKDTSFLAEGCAGKLEWKDLVSKRHIPAIALYTLIRCLEETCAIEVEHEYPRTAFVLSQSSYLKSVGFVDVTNADDEKDRAARYINMISSDKDKRQELREASACYELARWESGRGLLPYDLVEHQEGSEGNDSSEGDEESGGLKGYLVNKLGDPVPTRGFHLIDLDARFVYPAVGIHVVQRGRTGVIGRFKSGGPPAGASGLEAYRDLSRKIPRFVAAVTDGKGGGVLIAKERVIATYGCRGWSFYHRESATAKLKELVGSQADQGLAQEDAESQQAVECEQVAVLGRLLEIAEEMSQIHRKGAAFVLVDFKTVLGEEELDSGLRPYFVRMIGKSNSLVGLKVDLNEAGSLNKVISYGQVDGCCVVSADAKLISYGLKIAVSPEAAFLRENGRACPEKISELHKEGPLKDKLLNEIKRGEARLKRKLVQPGTRRWSSAMLSLATGWPVLIVSADGPVTCFLGEEKKRIYPSSEAR